MDSVFKDVILVVHKSASWSKHTESSEKLKSTGEKKREEIIHPWKENPRVSKVNLVGIFKQH